MRIEIHRHAIIGTDRDDGTRDVAYDVIVPLEDATDPEHVWGRSWRDGSVYVPLAAALWEDPRNPYRPGTAEYIERGEYRAAEWSANLELADAIGWRLLRRACPELGAAGHDEPGHIWYSVPSDASTDTVLVEIDEQRICDDVLAGVI